MASGKIMEEKTELAAETGIEAYCPVMGRIAAAVVMKAITM